MHQIEMLDTPWQEEYYSGNYNFGTPCQACGSNGQYISKVQVLKTCGQCLDFGPIGCTTSVHERKHGNANTPACDEFKGRCGAGK